MGAFPRAALPYEMVMKIQAGRTAASDQQWARFSQVAEHVAPSLPILSSGKALIL